MADMKNCLFVGILSAVLRAGHVRRWAAMGIAVLAACCPMCVNGATNSSDLAVVAGDGDVKGARACFRYGPAKCEPPALDVKMPYIVVKDDSGKEWRFPNVNGDTNVVCREIATERDLLYVGGVWYEVPADNAGGFSALRPIALADEPVKSLYGKLGLMYLNGKPMVIDDLWKNGTAAAAYWLWKKNKNTP